MSDVAREAGVSRALVSLAFRRAPGVSDRTRAHIFAVAEEMGYRPNSVASRLASKESATVGVFLLDLYNEIFADVYSGLREVVGRTDRHLVTAIGEADGSRDLPAMDDLLAARVDVTIAAGLMLSDAEIQRLDAVAPVVSATRAVEGVDSVFSDDRLGAELAVAHLHELGHRRIAHLASPQRQGYTARWQGYSAAMRDRGLPAVHVIAEYTQASAADAAGRLLDLQNAPTAIFANNDVAALGVMEALDQRGLQVGEDLSLVGYDNTPIAQLPTVALTSVDLHAKQLGRTAAELALSRIAEPERRWEHRSSAPELVARRSSRPLIRTHRNI